MSIDHFTLCKETARWAAKKNDLCIFDYQSYSTYEFPDCLAFKGAFTTLYEIKVDRADFIKDATKECRKSKVITYAPDYYWETDIRFARIHTIKEHAANEHYRHAELWCKEKEYPHLGRKRYYVCPAGLINPDETGNWGLIWYKDKRFSERKISHKFRNDMYSELAIMVHALRKQKNTGNDNVITKAYR